MDPRDFIVQADLLARTDTAVGHRSAVSRAYYGAYNVATELLDALRFRIPRGHAGHEAVQDRLHYAGVDSVIHAGAVLRRLQDVRARTDYRMRDPYPEDAAVVAYWLGEAAGVMRILDAAAADPPTRARMTRAIASWEQGRRTSR